MCCAGPACLCVRRGGGALGHVASCASCFFLLRSARSAAPRIPPGAFSPAEPRDRPPLPPLPLPPRPLPPRPPPLPPRSPRPPLPPLPPLCHSPPPRGFFCATSASVSAASSSRARLGADEPSRAMILSFVSPFIRLLRSPMKKAPLQTRRSQSASGRGAGSGGQCGAGWRRKIFGNGCAFQCNQCCALARLR